MTRYKHTVVGIDPSSAKLALTVTSPTGESFHVWKLPRSKWKLRECGYAYSATRELLKSLPGDVHVFLEAPAGVPGRGSFVAVIPQSQVGGAIAAACQDVNFTLVPNTEWKFRVLGYGKPSKTYLATRLETRWPAAHQAAITPRGKIDIDVVDSAWINMYGRMVVLDGDQNGTSSHAGTVRQRPQRNSRQTSSAGKRNSTRPRS